MAPKPKEGKQTGMDPAETAAELKALTESELVMAVLRSRLGRYQAAGEKLAIENFGLSDELAKQKLTLQDINEFLTNELKARSLAAAQLEEQAAQLNARLIEVQKEAQAELSRVKAEAAAELGAALARAAANEAAQGESELLEQKALLERSVAELNETLAAKQRESEARLGDLERRHLQEREKLRKEAAAKIRETKMAMAQLADQHLESSTKRTLVENETMAAELAYHTAQSHDLVAANTQLRAEAAELRRQLGVAHKSVRSTAEKNLLLQQTIKSILACLREEAGEAANAVLAGPAAAAAAAAGPHAAHVAALADAPRCSSPPAAQLQFQQLQQPQQDCMLGPHNGGDASNVQDVQCSMRLRQQEQLPEQQQEEQNHQQQQEVSDNVGAVPHLEDCVVRLANELAAAKLALAAAVQGALPGGLKPACSITVNTPSTAAAAAATDASSPAAAAGLHQRDSCCRSRVSKHKSRCSSPSAGRLQQQQCTCSISCCCGGWCCEQGGSPAASMSAALDDGVAAFVLHCVQQLRHGSEHGRTEASAAAASPSGARGAPQQLAALGPKSPTRDGRSNWVGCTGNNRKEPVKAPATAVAAAARASMRSPSRCASPMAAPAAAGASGAAASPTAAEAVGGGSQDSSSIHSHGVGAGRVSSTVAMPGSNVAGGSSSAMAADTAAEQLARLLLEQLHSYSRQKLAAYRGLAVDFGQQQPQQHIQQQVAAALATGDCGQSSRNSSQSAAAAANVVAAISSADVRGGSSSPLLDLPQLPCLLDGTGVRSPSASNPAQTGGAGVGAAGGACGRGSSPSRSDRSSVLSAVMSDVRPWGGGSSNPSTAGCITPGTGAPASASSSPVSATVSGMLNRSRAATSPAAGVKAVVVKGRPGLATSSMQN